MSNSRRDELKAHIAQNHLVGVTNALLASLGSAGAEDAQSLQNELVNILGRLNRLRQQQRQATIGADELSLAYNQIRVGLSHLVDEFPAEWLPPTPIKIAPEPPILAATQTSPATGKTDPLDNIFKLMILLLGLLSTGIFIYSIFTSTQAESMNTQLVPMAFSLVGGSGAFFGYMRWRLIELRISK